ncbi:RecJ-like exonuclease [Halarchaeum rubridurum]|uniref:Phosphoesterase n=1 Tax=Halarchaeum rubridurum TaxID=489911 RepID=A0A830FVI2_9EURY|nr:DHH family phosphoesterase [Halarchaeum rubridurum]MBP1953262.1 RecJ-like exonuclease [Halarchaeum rubridurum]GGM66651.1 phosphoesterase [Halarchaeum rubridurum]
MTDGSSDDDATPVVYRLAPECTVEAIDVGERYTATVNGVVDYGVFVDLSENVSGLLHESVLPAEADYEVGDDLVVALTEIRENGDLGFELYEGDDYTVEERAFAYDRAAAGALTGRVGDVVHVEGEIVQIKQTGGPTVFRLRDESGTVPCTAFEEAGVRAYPEIEIGDVVHVTGEVEEREGAVQVEIDALETLDEGTAEHVRARLDASTAERATPADVDPLVDWPAMRELYPDLERVARRLRRTVLESRPIRMRHHADGDGMCASVPVQLALERFIERTHEDPDAKRHLLKRLPSKAPYYEMEDATRDLNFALEDQTRHGQKLPLLLMLDNGSTEEDTPAYETLSHYDIPILVVDHHHPDHDAVDPLVDEHVNPYLHGEDYRVTTGMMCVELARMIAPSIADDLDHVPAVAGLSDRSKAEAMSDYLDLAREAGYDEEFLHDVSEALDYEAFWLRYSAGRNLINDVLNVGGDEERQRDLVPWLAERAERDVELQLDAALPHVEHETVDSGAHLYRIDVENYAHRFTYPAPGKTTGEIHDRKVEETGEPVITIGYGPDFAVLRSDGVRMDIPQMVTELNEEFPGAGVSGGGHLVVGSIRFVNGMREEVLDALVSKMADAEIDEELHSTLTR